jgi:hypothetical protein
MSLGNHTLKVRITGTKNASSSDLYVQPDRVDIITNSCTNVSLVTQPSNASVTSPATATFTIAAAGTAPTYQWQKSTDGGTTYANVTDGTGGTTATYTTPATSTGMNGYKYRCNVSNSCPSRVTSSVVTLTVSGGVTTTVNDRTLGTGLSQFDYQGAGWGGGSGVGCSAYNDDCSWSNTVNTYALVRFNGTQIKFYGYKDANAGISACSVDGGTETNADFYGSCAGNSLLYTSAVLSAGNHTLKVRVTATKNGSSSDSYVQPDRVDIIQ